MTNDFRRTIAAIACTALFSTLCIVGAVGPAQASAQAPAAPIAAVASI